MSRLKVWLLASRPATLTAVASPLLVGGVIALPTHKSVGEAWLAAFLGALFIQLGTNYANDVFDYEKGADTAERVGPMRAVQAGLVTPRQMRIAMILAFALATLCGTYLVWLRGWPLVWIGVASIVSGIAYTGGPFPLGYNGLGDVFVFVFFGIVATAGTYFAQTGQVDTLGWLYGVPVGCTCTAILVVNNLRDMDTDAKVGKRTLAVRFGAAFVRTEYALLLGVALAYPLLVAVYYTLKSKHLQVGLSLPLLLVPSAIRLTRTLCRTRDPAVLNPLLGATARFHLWYGLLTAVGWLLAWNWI
jgi:1,4-dihydroxy-2-naphthoate octaprenyltransferase